MARDRGVPWWGAVCSAAAPVLLGVGSTIGGHLQPRPYNAMTGTIQGLTFPDLVHVLGYSETLLSNGKVLLAGGLANGLSGFINYTYLYDPTNQSFKPTGPLVNNRGYHTATLLTDGRVLIAGGYSGTPETDYASAELYDPANGSFSKTTSMTRPRADHTATLLRDGRVLFVGGELMSGTPGGPESTAELYVPDGLTTTSTCGKYGILDGQCRRIAILPWYAGILGQWETDINLDSSVGAVRFAYIESAALTYDGIGHNMLLDASDLAGSFIAEGVDSIQGNYSARILGGEDCVQSNCKTVPSTGSLVVTIDGPNAAALDASSVRATLKLLSADGTVLGQADAPVVFADQASRKWVASITDTPLSKQSQPGATVVSFAVANLAAAAQAVNVKVFDAPGNLVVSATTPVLNGAASLGSPFEAVNAVGGVYAVTLSGLLGMELVPSAGDTVFRGTVTFEGAAGGKIAPLIVQMNWPSITSIPARRE